MGAYWSIILSLNGFCLWVRPCEHRSHTGLLHTLPYLVHHVVLMCYYWTDWKEDNKKSHFSSSIGKNQFFTVSQSKHHSGGCYFSSLLHTNVHSLHLFTSLLYASTALYSLLMGQGVWCPLAWRWHLSLTAQGHYKYQAQVPCAPTFWQL